MSKKMYGRHKKYTITPTLMCTGVFLMAMVFGSLGAKAQVANEPWRFKDQNRASIAALMRQIDKEQTAATEAVAAGDALVCGDGGGSSSSKGNATCIILNNANAAIEIGQTSDGEQQATNTAPANSPQSPADDVLNTLSQ